MIFEVGDIIQYLMTRHKDNDNNNDESDQDTRDASEPEDTKTKWNSRSKKKQVKRERKRKSRPVNVRQKECYLKHKIVQPVELEVPLLPPLLFFECAHYYGSTQYVRLLLVRQSDPKVEWCRQFCKEINLSDNPFFKFDTRKVWTYQMRDRTRSIIVEMLIVGDIIISELCHPPKWDDVGKLTRAGGDPMIGVCEDYCY